MQSASSVAAALIQWAVSVLPEVQSTHDYPHEEDPGPFPDLAVDLREIRTIPGPTAHYVRKQLTAVLSVLVSPMPYRDSAQALWSMADRLIDAQRNDRTLGIALHGISMQSSPWVCGLPGVITWPDGTQGRALTATSTLVVLA